MKTRIAAVAALTVLLAGCGDDLAKACFDTADHANLSDGKIKGMCDCAVKQIDGGGFSQADRDILAAAIRGKDEAGGKRSAEMVGYWALAMSKCRSQ